MLKANVWQSSSVRHSISGFTADGVIVPVQELAVAQYIEVTAGDGGFYLFRFSQSGQPLGDTWHETLTEAFAQADFEFGVKKDDWQRLEEKRHR